MVRVGDLPSQVVLALLRETGVVVYDRDGRVQSIWSSPELDQRYGVEAAKAIGRSVMDFHPQDQAEAALARIRRVFETGDALRAEYAVDSPKGHFCLEDSCSPMRDASGRTVGVVSFVRDMTGSKRREAALRESEERFRTLVENSPDLILTVDRDGEILFTNRPSFGQTIEELIGRSIYDYLCPEHHKAYKRILAMVFESGEPAVSQCRTQDPGGLTTWREDHISSIKKGGTAVATMITSADITLRKQAEEDLETSRQQLHLSERLAAVGTLAGALAHDFSSLQTVIFGYVNKARKTLPEGHPALDSLEMVKRVARHATGITQSLLAFARPAPADKERALMGHLCHETSRWLSSLLPATIEQVWEITDVPLGVYGDALQLQQLLMNLVLNARDAMPGGGTLRVALTSQHLTEETLPSGVNIRPGQYCRLEVTDTGVGIPDNIKKRVFDPFFTTKPHHAGTGLGLAIARRIVEDHGGWISVDSQPGRGTSFTVLLPCCKEESDHSAPAESEECPALPPGTVVLIVESDNWQRSFIASTLRDCGCTVVQARDGAQGVDEFRSHVAETDCVVVDADLPILTGIECVERIRALAPEVPCFVTTDRTGDDELRSAAALISCEVIYKPFQTRDLILALGRALRAKESLR